MNKKGFTLVELIGVIVILAILSLLAVTTYSRVMNNTAIAQLKDKILNIEKAAMAYGQDNKNELSESCTIDGEVYSNCKTDLTVGDLLNDNWLESEETDTSGNATLINNVTKKDMKNDIVIVYRKNNRVYATMDCVHFASNDNVCPQ